jgi:DNA-binding NarL/FixJ family response regulator
MAFDDQTEKKRVLIVEDHPIVRRGFASLINHEPDLEVCGQAEDVHGALEAIDTLEPDLVLIDIFLKDSSGIDLIKTLQERRKGLPLLVVSMHEESLYADRVIRAGAMGYVMKREAEQTIVTAIRRILDGRIYLSDRMQERVLMSYTGRRTDSERSPFETLSDRELEIFERLGHGQSIRKIADDLHLSVKTVDAHRARIKEKLGLESSTEVLQHAVRWVQSGNET